MPRGLGRAHREHGGQLAADVGVVGRADGLGAEVGGVFRAGLAEGLLACLAAGVGAGPDRGAEGLAALPGDLVAVPDGGELVEDGGQLVDGSEADVRLDLTGGGLVVLGFVVLGRAATGRDRVVVGERRRRGRLGRVLGGVEHVAPRDGVADGRFLVGHGAVLSSGVLCG